MTLGVKVGGQFDFNRDKHGIEIKLQTKNKFDLQFKYKL